jgi:hypothetical protein
MEYAQFDEYDLLGRLPQSVFGGEVFAGCLLISRDAGSGCFKHARFLPSLFLSKHGLKPN